MNCPLCGKRLDIEPEERKKFLEKLTQIRVRLGKFDAEIKKMMEETQI